MPEELDQLEREIRQQEIAREAVKREGDTAQVETITEELANLEEERDRLRARWEQEKSLIQEVQSAKEEIDALKVEAEELERQGDFGKVAEIRYGQIPGLEAQIDDTNARLDELQADGALLKEEVGAEDIAEVISRATGIPVNKMLEAEKEKLLGMEAELERRVIGQPEAIEAVANAVRRGRAGLQESSRPIGSFIFLGTTGVGKTELAKALAEQLFDDEGAVIRIDMSEYQERHAVSRLIGAPPGYVGYDEGGQLTEAVRRRPYSVVLLDEFEKAHPEVFNVLLQVLDDGRLTDNQGHTVDFTNTLVIMTSNLGSDLIKRRMEMAGDEPLSEEQMDGLQADMLGMLRQTLRPEFLNRIDEIIVFRPLGREQIRKIVAIQFAGIQRLAARNHHITLSLTDAASDYLAKKGYDPIYGARPLKRVIQREVANRLAEQILGGFAREGDTVEVDVTPDGAGLTLTTDASAPTENPCRRTGTRPRPDRVVCRTRRPPCNPRGASRRKETLPGFAVRCSDSPDPPAFHAPRSRLRPLPAPKRSRLRPTGARHQRGRGGYRGDPQPVPRAFGGVRARRHRRPRRRLRRGRDRRTGRTRFRARARRTPRALGLTRRPHRHTPRGEACRTARRGRSGLRLGVL